LQENIKRKRILNAFAIRKTPRKSLSSGSFDQYENLQYPTSASSSIIRSQSASEDLGDSTSTSQHDDNFAVSNQQQQQQQTSSGFPQLDIGMGNFNNNNNSNLVTLTSQMFTLYTSYALTIAIDMSSSMASMDSVTGEIILDRVYPSIERLLYSLLSPMLIGPSVQVCNCYYYLLFSVHGCFLYHNIMVIFVFL